MSLITLVTSKLNPNNKLAQTGTNNPEPLPKAACTVIAIIDLLQLPSLSAQGSTPRSLALLSLLQLRGHHG